MAGGFGSSDWRDRPPSPTLPPGSAAAPVQRGKAVTNSIMWLRSMALSWTVPSVPSVTALHCGSQAANAACSSAANQPGTASTSCDSQRPRGTNAPSPCLSPNTRQDSLDFLFSDPGLLPLRFLLSMFTGSGSPRSPRNCAAGASSKLYLGWYLGPRGARHPQRPQLMPARTTLPLQHQ